jgi:hypothetical protein
MVSSGPGRRHRELEEAPAGRQPADGGVSVAQQQLGHPGAHPVGVVALQPLAEAFQGVGRSDRVPRGHREQQPQQLLLDLR